MIGTIKTLRRRCIIREYDFKKQYARSLIYYDTATFKPLSLAQLEKEVVFKRLKGETWTSHKYVLGDPDSVYKAPKLWLLYMKDYLYNPEYHSWNITTEGDDQTIFVQYRNNTPKSCLGWAEYIYQY